MPMFQRNTPPESVAAIAANIQLLLFQPILGPCNITPSNMTYMQTRWSSLYSFNHHLITTINIPPTFVIISLKYVQKLVNLRSYDPALSSDLRVWNVTNDPGDYGSENFSNTSTANRIASNQNPQQILTLSPRSLILTSYMMALKFFDDRRILNKVYAEIGGIDVDTLNKVERDCLCALGYDLQVDPHEYRLWEDLIVNYTIPRSWAVQYQAPQTSQNYVLVPLSGTAMLLHRKKSEICF